MNVKNKIVALVMSFVICFGSVSNSFAYDKKSITTVSAPLVATVATIAVACGVSLNDDSDLYDVVSIFYDKYKENQEIIKSTFELGVSILANKVVTVSKDFLELVKGAFDEYASKSKEEVSLLFIEGFGFSKPIDVYKTDETVYVQQGNFRIYFKTNGFGLYYNDVRLKDVYAGGYTTKYDRMQLVLKNGVPHIKSWKTTTGLTVYHDFSLAGLDAVGAPPNFNEYDWDKINQRLEGGSLGLHMPGYLGDLIGKNPSDVVYDGVNSNPYDKPYDGVITLPGVKNPSIDSTLEGTFNPSLDTDIPGTSNPSVPNEGIWSTIKDFVVSLVVPSDTFWTDLFTGFSDNLHKNFPMLDMSAFNSLLVDGKPFPNMFAFGGKIVDGDTINSIVDWLRPIVAGFVMLLLLFFNYRKLHKVIRNSDPYGSVAEKGCTSNVN